MPVSGPDCDAAQREAIKANKEIWLLLKKEYHLTLDERFGVHPKRMSQLESLLIDIFLEDTCKGF